jgi:plastocyanin
MFPRIALVSSGALILAVAVACSDSSTSPSPAPDAGSSSTSSGSSSGAPVDSGADTGAAVNGCTTFVDRTADDASRSLKWDADVAQLPERCMKIKVGQSLKLTEDGAFLPADLGTHPAIAAGGATPSPFTDPGVDATGNVVFEKAGTYGFACGNHSSEKGAVLVVP